MRWRLTLSAAVAGAGLLALGGSGGGVGFPDFSPGPVEPYIGVTLTPEHVITTAGVPVRLSAYVYGSAPTSIGWCRQAAGSPDCATIAGANALELTLDQPSIADDGATYRITVHGDAGTANASADLRVSSAPAVAIADGDFDPARWSVDTIAQPAEGGPTLDAGQAADGGHPGTWRRFLGHMTAGPSRLRGLHVYTAATYDPATQGEVRLVVMDADCRLVQGLDTVQALVWVAPLVEQAGRRYVALARREQCNMTMWWPLARWPWLTAASFTQLDGPACGTGERCPDFTTAGAVLRFGVLSESALAAGAPAQDTEHGIDNWSVHVWRP